MEPIGRFGRWSRLPSIVVAVTGVYYPTGVNEGEPVQLIGGPP
jgi:hypothetical protein